MDSWIPGVDNREQVSSISGVSPQSGAVGSIKPDEPKEAITQLGSSYEIKNVTVAKKTNLPFPTALLVFVVIAPLIFVFAMGAFSVGKKEEKGSFLFDTLESKYFTLGISEGYQADSVVDKKIPFLERHVLTNTTDGQKSVTIMIKDIKFDYDVKENLGAKARDENSAMYSQMPYELGGNKGLYYKKTQESFEHFVLLVDKEKSILYEISMESPTTFATDLDLSSEFQKMLEKITFL